MVLRDTIASTVPYIPASNTSTHQHIEKYAHKNNTHSHEHDHNSHRFLAEVENSKKIDFSERKNRVFFCFHHENNIFGRNEVLENAKQFCSNCDFCNDTVKGLSHAELWHEYTQYKFVYSPYGDGFDCGRTWEIMLLGELG